MSQARRLTRAENDLTTARDREIELRLELAKSKEALQAAQAEMIIASPKALVEKIRDIERRGNVTIDLKNGDVDIIRGLDFKPRKTTETPDAEFSDYEKGDATLQDVAELVKMFDVPLVVEGHSKGGENEFWQQLASNRSRYVMDKLIEFGIPKGHIIAKGLPGKKGRNKACIVIRLDIFPGFD